MAKKKSLPKRLYVYEDNDRDGTTWFVAYEDVGDCADMAEKRLVGTYDLRNMIRVGVEVVTKPA